MNNSNNKIIYFISQHPLKTPVLFLIFNRLDTTKEVFAQIRKAKPPKLYIAADGPRENILEEKNKVEEVRKYVLNNIDWKCEVKTLFREKNLGCKYAVSEAITWFFENEEMGIILEDDTVPSQSFFWFCEELLDRYKDDERIGMITGTSYLFNEIDSRESFFFSKYMSIWGWASWKRVWKNYDVEMTKWPYVKKQEILKSIFYWDKNLVDLYTKYYDRIFNNEIDTWDAQFGFICRINSQYCVTPYKNLITNIGLKGTRKIKKSPFLNMKRVEINNITSIIEPIYIYHNLEIDKKLFYNIFYRFHKRWKLYLKEILHKIVY